MSAWAAFGRFSQLLEDYYSFLRVFTAFGGFYLCKNDNFFCLTKEEMLYLYYFFIPNSNACTCKVCFPFCEMLPITKIIQLHIQLKVEKGLNAGLNDDEVMARCIGDFVWILGVRSKKSLLRIHSLIFKITVIC